MSVTEPDHINIVDNQTQLCVSLAARPSNHGVRFHNWLYGKLGLNFLYKAFAPTDITQAVAGIRGLGIRGAGVSMPFKADVLELVDEVHFSAGRIHAANTIVNTDGHLVAYNTDYTAVAELIKDIPTSYTTIVRGSGGMASAVVQALADHGLKGTIASRNPVTGQELAARVGWEWTADSAIDAGTVTADLIVNVTPLGMNGSDDGVQSFPDSVVSSAKLVFDVVAYPVNTPLIQAAQRLGVPSLNGGQVIALQAAEQFALYTGITPDQELVDAAEAYAQS